MLLLPSLYELLFQVDIQAFVPLFKPSASCVGHFFEVKLVKNICGVRQFTALDK